MAATIECTVSNYDFVTDDNIYLQINIGLNQKSIVRLYYLVYHLTITVIVKITITIVVLMIITVDEEVPGVVVVGVPISDEHVSSP